MTETDPDRLLTREKIAAVLGHVSADALLKATQRGEIAYYPVGRRHLYRLADVAEWLEERRKPGKVGGFVRARATPLALTGRSNGSTP